MRFGGDVPICGCAILLISSMMGIGVITAPVCGQAVLHVDSTAGQGGDGSSWGAAFNSLQTALDVVGPTPSWPITIKVAQGRYVPSKRTDDADPRSITFKLVNKLTLQGGYAGLAGADPDAHDPQLYETILSGDINGDDQENFVNYDENAYHVLIGSDTDSTAVLDGFTISGGNANSSVFPPESFDAVGGGLLNSGGSAMARNCLFRRNYARGSGASYCWGGQIQSFSSCRFVENKAQNGAAITSGSMALELSGCVFLHNDAQSIIVGTSPSTSLTVVSCAFLGNSATVGIGGLSCGGSVEIRQTIFRENHGGYFGALVHDGSQIVIKDCEFTGNSSDWTGGAVLVSGNALISNCIFSRNQAVDGGGVTVLYDAVITNCSFSANSGGGTFAFDPNAHPLIMNSIFWGNSPYQVGVGTGGPPPPPPDLGLVSLYNCDIQGGWYGLGSNNIDADPRFVQPGCDNLRLAFDSPCLNAGNNSYIPAGVKTDLDGLPRIQDGIVDMGAYEGGHEMLPLAACADDIAQGDFVRLIPMGGPFNPIEHAAANIRNTAGPDHATAMATQFDHALHPMGNGFNEIGDALTVETSIIPGNFWMRIVIPFDAATLHGFDPFDVYLTSFDPANNLWLNAPASNVQNSPGHSGPIGDRILEENSDNAWNWTQDLGDYGVFWNPTEQRGFAWANVDHASDFAFGVPRPACDADCTYPGDGVVNQTDLATVIGAWGLAQPGPVSFADVTRDGVVNVKDLMAVINGWGACP